VVGVVVIALALAALALMVEVSSRAAWSAFVLLLVLMVVSVPLLRRAATGLGDPDLFRILMWGLAAAFVFSVARYLFIFEFSDGGDAGVYHQGGATFVDHLRRGLPLHPIPAMEPYPVESRRVGDAVGVVYVLTGPSVFAGFLAFTYLCFWGKVLIIRAFAVAVPEGDLRRYALLVLFLPTLLFWPASIGKEALMMACLGLIVYGGALLLAPRPKLRGVLYFLMGALLVLLVRPHLALMSILALGVAMGIGATGRVGVSSGRGRAARFIALGLLVVLALYGATRLTEQFEEYADDGAQAALDGTLERSSIGGSAFDPVAVTAPHEVPAAVVSVFFRPFPWEAGNVASLMAASESLLLLGLVAISWRRIASFPSLSLRRPFLLYCLSYVVLFAVGFSFIGNFGILARQRSLALPILLVFLALPVRRSARSTPARSGGADTDQGGLPTSLSPMPERSGGRTR
jgi:hypothetical protein